MFGSQRKRQCFSRTRCFHESFRVLTQKSRSYQYAGDTRCGNEDMPQRHPPRLEQIRLADSTFRQVAGFVIA